MWKRTRMRYNLLIWMALLICVMCVNGSTIGNTTDACDDVKALVSEGKLVLNATVLKMVEKVQRILDCVPDATEVVVNIDSIPVQEGLTFKHPITFGPKDSVVTLECSPNGIQIRSRGVTLRGLRIDGCKGNEGSGFVLIDSHDISLDRLQFSRNINNIGKSFVSIRNSGIALQNVFVDHNRGRFLSVAESNLTVVNSTFRNNGGGVLNLASSTLTVRNSSFIENQAPRSGGAILMRGGRLKVESSNFTGNSVLPMKGPRPVGPDQGGGAIATIDVLIAEIKDTYFVSNGAKKGGGAVQLTTSRDARTHRDAHLLIFDGASKQKALSVGTDSRKTVLSITGSIFLNNTGKEGGAVLARAIDTFNVTQTIFTKNYASQGRGGGFQAQEIFTGGNISSSSFDNNEATSGGAIAFLGGGSPGLGGPKKKWLIWSTNFSSNYASKDGGAIHGEQGFHLNITDSNFDSNTAGREGGALNFGNRPGSPPVQLLLFHSTLVNNTAGAQSRNSLNGEPNSGGGAISVSGGSARFVSNYTYLFENKAGIGGAILGKDKALLTIENFNMSGNTAILGGALACTSVSKLQLSHGFFRNNSAEQGGAMYVTGPVQYPTDMQRLKDSDIYSRPEGYSITISKANFVGNEAVSAGGAVYISSHSLGCSECQIEANSVEPGAQKITGVGGGLYISSNAVVNLRNSTVRECKADVGAGLFVRNGILKGANLRMVGNHALDAGAAIAAKFGPRFTINDQRLSECHGCSFRGNHAARVGIIYVVIEEENTKKPPDSRLSGRGENLRNSTVLVERPKPGPRPPKPGPPKPKPRPPSPRRHVSFDIVEFSENTVLNSGPLMIFTNSLDFELCCGGRLTCSTGGNLTSKRCIDENQVQQRVFGTFIKNLAISPSVIVDHSSGEEIAGLTVDLMDGFDDIVPMHATLIVKPPNNSVELSGSPTTGMVLNGTSVVTGITVRAKPGEYDLNFEVTSTEAGSQTFTKNLPVTVRKCQVGEIANADGIGCWECPENFYSFDPSKSTCDLCPENRARCDGPALVPLDNFWHNDSHSDNLIRCMNSNACSYPNRTNLLIAKAAKDISVGLAWDDGYPLCNKGYRGVLCGSCSEIHKENGPYVRYGKDSSLNCAQCMGIFKLTLYVFFCVAVLTALTILFVKGASDYARETLSRGSLPRWQTFPLWEVQNADEITTWLSENLSTDEAESIEPEDILKIAVNFLQVSTIVTSFKVDWQETVLKVVDAFDWLSGVATGSAYFALSCAFKHSSRFIYANVLAASLPFAVWFGFVLRGLTVLRLGIISLPELKTFCFVSGMAILDISYIGLTQKMVQIFYCVSVELKDGKISYWAEDTNVKCWSTPHLYLAGFAGLPLLVFVSFGFPACLFWKLYRRKDRLHTSVVVSRFGFFYQAYHANFAYWEVLIQFRKGLLAVISVLSLTLSDQMKGYLALCVILVASALQSRCSPYKEQKLNRMELASLFISAFLCVFQGITESPEGNGVVKTIMTVGIFMSLSGFMLYMAYEYAMAHKKSFNEWLKKQKEYKKHTGGAVSLIQVCACIICSRSQSVLMSMWKWVCCVHGESTTTPGVNGGHAADEDDKAGPSGLNGANVPLMDS